MFKKLSVALMLVAVMVLGFASFASAAPKAAPEGDTIVEIAVGNPNFSTLVAAVSKAGLVDTLNGKGQYTVFAPTNAAFDNLAVALGPGDRHGPGECRCPLRPEGCRALPCGAGRALLRRMWCPASASAR